MHFKLQQLHFDVLICKIKAKNQRKNKGIKCNLSNLLTDLGTSRHEYHQICVCIHKVMDSQILVYYNREYPLNYLSHVVADFIQKYQHTCFFFVAIPTP